LTTTDDARPYQLKAGGGTSIWTLGTLMTFKATAETTEGRFTSIDETVSAHTKPPLHTHHREDECCYVLEGEIVFQVGDHRYEATTGDFILMPREMTHAFAVRSESARVPALFAPGGLEGLFHAVGELERSLALPPPTGRLSDEELADRRRRAHEHGIEIVGPPLRL
jgi:quercetin dioxygenase-like cupin family protein